MLPGLVPFFDLLYSKRNKCNYRRADGATDSRDQEEGFAQGCPLLNAFAALVLHDILSQLHSKLRDLARECKRKGHPSNDNGHRGVTHIMANGYGTSAVVPLVDMEFFCRRFVELGRPLGARLAEGKTVVMTACDGVSPLNFVAKETCDSVREAIDTYCRKPGEAKGHEETWGTRLLGYPIGGRKFAREYLQQTVSEINMHTHDVCMQLGDLQTMLQVYQSAILPKVPHLFAADVHHNTAGLCGTFKWCSSFATALTTKTRDLLARITRKSTVLTWVLAIAHLQVRAGGLGTLNSMTYAIPLYIQLVTSSLHALDGIPLWHRPNDPVRLPQELQEFFGTWDRSSVPFFVKYRLYAEKAFCWLYPDEDNVVAFAIHHGKRTKVAKAIKDTNIDQEVENVHAFVPPEVRPYLPAMLCRHTLLALVGMG